MEAFLVLSWVQILHGLFLRMPGGSKHIPREFYPPQNSHLCLRRRRNSGSHGMACPSSLPCLTPVSLSFFNSNYESKDSVDCSCGSLEGPSIFLESFILFRVLICACGEGEIVCVIAWLFPLPVWCLDPSAFSSLIMSPQIPWTVHVDAWRGQAYS